MNILIVHNEYIYKGGEETVINTESEILKSFGNNLFFYKRKSKEIEDMNIFQKIATFFGIIYSYKTYREVSKIIKEESIDVVHVHNIFPLISFSVYYAAKKNNCKLVQTLHNFRFLCPKGLLFRDGKICEDCLKNGLKCAIKHNCYRESKLQTILLVLVLSIHKILGTFNKPDSYIVMTEFNKNIFRKYLPEEKIEIRSQFFKGNKILSDSCSHKNYVIISRLEDSKGIQIAINAFKELKDKELIIIGKGQCEKKYKDFIENNNINNIKMLGYKENNEVLEYLKNAKALILPSLWYEGYPMTIVESIAVGTPIIGSNIGNVNSIIKSEEIGITYQYDDYRELIKSVELLEKDDNLYSKLLENAKKAFDKYHSTSSLYKETERIYKQ